MAGILSPNGRRRVLALRLGLDPNRVYVARVAAILAEGKTYTKWPSVYAQALWIANYPHRRSGLRRASIDFGGGDRCANRLEF
jgi:hypothetical protein